MTTIGRRDFIATGAGVLVVGLSWPDASAQTPPTGSSGRLTPVPPARSPLAPEDLDTWLTIDADGKVVFYTGRIDMGTGVHTAFAQVLADELDVPFEAVSVVMGDTGLTTDSGKSTGSSNMERGMPPLRTAAAEARALLLELAAQRLQVPASQLAVNDGVVSVDGDATRSVRYGALVAGRRLDRKVKVRFPTITYLGWDAPRIDGRGPLLEGPAPHKTTGFRYIGRSIPRRDVPTKVTGRHEYVHTVRLPQMVHGRMVRPPTIGATLLSVDEKSIAALPGVIRVVRINNFLGVVAEREDQATQAAAQLAARWSAPTGSLPNSATLSSWLKSAKQIQSRTRDRGNVDPAFARAAKTLNATYEWPIQNHGMIGPSCSVADVRSDQATIWTASQWIQQNRRDLARMLDLPVESVRLIWKDGSGSYGRMACDDAAADAALLSRAVGRPVRVRWTRQEEHAWEPKSPGMVLDMRGGLDSSGNVVAVSLEGWSPSHSTAEVGNFLAWRLIGGNPGWDRLSGGEGNPGYTWENVRTTGHYVEEVLRAVYMRSPGGVQHTFAIESFIDEMAASAGADPLAFRQRYLTDERSVRLLRAVADQSGWQPRPTPPGGRPRTGVVSGRGICLSTRQAAAVVDVDVNLDTGALRVTRAWVAATCGRIVNPEGMRHQLQGAFLQAISRSLFEEVTFENGRVTSTDWRSYPIMRFPDVPDIKTILLDEPDKESEGLGEIAVDPAPAAIANAVFDATGVRLRRVPFTPARVKAALA